MLSFPLFAQPEPLAYWDFDEIDNKHIRESISGIMDEIRGNFWIAEGVKGSCLKLDGYTTHLSRSPESIPEIDENLTIEAWVAPQTYPWNWTGIVDHEQDRNRGFFFGISAQGNVGLGAASIADGQWHMCVSKGKIEPLKWSHIAATLDESFHMKVYINGELSGEYSPEEYGWEFYEGMREAHDTELWIGKSHRKMYPAGTERPPSRAELSDMVFDGLIDEIKIYDEVLDEDEIRKA
jgi:hypothetical protein